MKKEGFLKLILAILVTVLLCIVSVGGIYVKDKNIMKNVLPKYNLGMDLDTSTIIKLEVNKNENSSSEDVQEEVADENPEQGTEENGQAENKYTADNYKKAKNVLEKRIKQFGINQYTIRLDEQTGDIVLEIPNDTDTSKLQNAFIVGKTEIVIPETNEVIGDANSFAKIEASIDNSYESYGIGSVVKLDVTFNKETVKKFKELKDSYVIPTDEEGNSKENSMQILIDGVSICNMYESEFLNAAVKGSMPLQMGSYSNDQKELEEALEEAESIKNIIDNGELPLTYTIEYSNDIHSNITGIGISIVFAIILGAMLIYFAVKHKVLGLVGELCVLGLGAVLLLVLRYTNVEISIASLVSIGAILILQFIYMNQLLSNEKLNSKVFAEKTIQFTKMLIPVFLISIIIAFANITEISGFGMIIFWGLILFELFNNILTRAIITNVKNK